MFPGVSGFAWDAGHIIFLGAFFTVVVIVLTTMTLAALRMLRERKPAREQAIRWHTDFSELPAADRRCRHELTGGIEERQCPNEFDCRVCKQHPILARLEPGPMAEVETQTVIAGIPVPLDRLYHRGHTWARREADGTYTIGVDPFAARLFGLEAKFELPKAGDPVFANGIAFHVRCGKERYRMLSPVTGEVIAASGESIRVRPDPGFRTDHLLKGYEVTCWLRREFDRLQLALGGSVPEPALADGGVMVENLPEQYPEFDWDDVRARMLLNT
jgi:hypothetical protein